jgi:hypothetical protein
MCATIFCGTCALIQEIKQVHRNVSALASSHWQHIAAPAIDAAAADASGRKHRLRRLQAARLPRYICMVVIKLVASRYLHPSAAALLLPPAAAAIVVWCSTQNDNLKHRSLSPCFTKFSPQMNN